MDPGEESELGTAAFPPPAPAATSAPGPKIFVISPLPGNIYDVDRYYYAPSADVTSGDFATLIAFGAHYRLPIAIFNCPDLVSFQVKHASAIVRPFSEVPPPILIRGHVLLGTGNASSASASKRADSTSCSAPLQFHGILILLPWQLPLGHLALRSPQGWALISASRLGILLVPPVALILKGWTVRLLSWEEWGE